jgi:protein-disulfide isomerase
MLLVSAAALAVAAVVIGLAMANLRPASVEPTSLTRPGSALPAALLDGPAIGSTDAPVTLEVVSDYQCPVCGRFAREYLARLVTEFVAPGTLRIVERPIAFLGIGDPDESLDAAVGVTCAGRQDRYWEYHDYLMWNQDGENEGAYVPERLAAMADAVGVDRAAWDACVADPTVAAGIRSATSQAAAAGINSTPTFLVNGQVIVGLVPYDQLAAQIRAAAG